jgi:hypothetical protein
VKQQRIGRVGWFHDGILPALAAYICRNGHEHDSSLAYELCEVFIHDEFGMSEGVSALADIITGHMKDHVQCSGMSRALVHFIRNAIFRSAFIKRGGVAKLLKIYEQASKLGPRQLRPASTTMTDGARAARLAGRRRRDARDSPDGLEQSPCVSVAKRFSRSCAPPAPPPTPPRRRVEAPLARQPRRSVIRRFSPPPSAPRSAPRSTAWARRHCAPTAADKRRRRRLVAVALARSVPPLRFSNDERSSASAAAPTAPPARRPLRACSQ